MAESIVTPGRVCPGCQSAMQTFQAGKVALERCFFCGGVYLDQGELECLAGQPVALTPGETPGQRLCAGCGATLVPTRAGTLTVDQCPSCGGIYLDAGELERLAGKVDLTRTGAPPDPERFRFKCPGCGEIFDADEGVTTGRGLACPGCAPGFDTLEGGDPFTPAGGPGGRMPVDPIDAAPARKRKDPMAFELGLLNAALQALALFLGI